MSLETRLSIHAHRKRSLFDRGYVSARRIAGKVKIFMRYFSRVNYREGQERGGYSSP